MHKCDSHCSCRDMVWSCAGSSPREEIRAGGHARAHAGLPRCGESVLVLSEGCAILHAGEEPPAVTEELLDGMYSQGYDLYVYGDGTAIIGDGGAIDRVLEPETY